MVDSKLIKVRELVKAYKRDYVLGKDGFPHFQRVKDADGNDVYELKTVSFYIDKQLYAAIKASYDTSTEEGKEAYIDILSEEYECFADQDRYNKHTVSMDSKMKTDDGDEIERQFADDLDDIANSEQEEQSDGINFNWDEAMSVLTNKQREVVTLILCEGMKQKDVAELLGVDKRTISDLYHRALAKLKSNVRKK